MINFGLIHVKGFCSHYAGALVYILRAANIPARVVGGYQGGEINPLTGHVVVRQYLAHAWVEYWQENKGWQRVDPTAAVAPSRIHDSLSSALPENDLDSLSIFTNARLNGVPGLQKMLFFFESLEARWNLFVIGYNTERQSDFLQKLFGKITSTKIAFVLLLGALLSAAFVALSLVLANPRKPKHPVIKVFVGFVSRLHKKGFERSLQETPSQFIEKVSKQSNVPETEYTPVTKILNALLYDPNTIITKEKLAELKLQLNTLQRKVCMQSIHSS